MLAQLLLLDSIAKGGPGSGPHGGGQHLAPFNDHNNKRVMVDQPGHAMHGKIGTVVRNMGNESAVDFKGPSVEWIKTEHLTLA